ncbi:MAG: tRNA (guanosine(37)-N1)-methyltransferase TrmD [Vallitaleaceae bacterium]|jgi:tRNA (guanine37-N1)-methyltransferase|nr:tRNA (guanosine(37)-N1)-methyltransferase TrmD [Vallitaleaceae bacterium]
MKFHIMTLFPEMIEQTLSSSIIGNANSQDLIHIQPVNIRDFSKNKHKKVDDYPYGGGAGMVMQPQPIMDAYRHIQTYTKKNTKVIYLTPQGKPFNQEMAESFAKEEALIFLCGHYEGVDERVIESIVTEEISIGDYILTGGELAVMVMIDCISRLVPGVLGNSDSHDIETFDQGLIEYPQYTRPAEYEGQVVPEVLLSGHHLNIERWRYEQSLIRTAIKRPDLYDKLTLTVSDEAFVKKSLQK